MTKETRQTIKKGKTKQVLRASVTKDQTATRASRLVSYLDKKDEDHLIFTGFLVIIIALVTIAAVQVTMRPTNSVVSTPIPFHTRILTSNERGNADGYEVAISNVTVNESADPAFPIESDETMLIMDFSITNHTPKQQDFTPVTQLYVRSREGNYYQMHASTKVQNPISAAVIEPEQTVSGQISFAVPKRLSEPLLYIDTGWNNTTPLVFDVLK